MRKRLDSLNLSKILSEVKLDKKLPKPDVTNDYTEIQVTAQEDSPKLLNSQSSLKDQLEAEAIQIAKLIKIVEDIESIKTELYQKRDALQNFINSGFFSINLPYEYADVFNVVSAVKNQMAQIVEKPKVSNPSELSVKPPEIVISGELIDGFNTIQDEEFIKGRSFTE